MADDDTPRLLECTDRLHEYSDWIIKHLGDILFERRQALGLTRPQLIDRLPYVISRQTVASYEQGIRVMPMDRLIHLCMALGVSLPAVLREAIQRADHVRCPACGEVRGDG